MGLIAYDNVLSHDERGLRQMYVQQLHISIGYAY